VLQQTTLAATCCNMLQHDEYGHIVTQGLAHSPRGDERICMCTANPTWGDIFECCFKAQSSKIERLFSLKRGKRDVRSLSFELSKMSTQVGLAVYLSAIYIYLSATYRRLCAIYIYLSALIYLRTHSLSLTHTHIHTHSLTLSLSLSFSLCVSASLSLSRYPSLILSLSLPHTHTHTNIQTNAHLPFRRTIFNVGLSDYVFCVCVRVCVCVPFRWHVLIWYCSLVGAFDRPTINFAAPNDREGG